MPLEESLQREEGLKTNDHLNTSQYLGIAQHPKYFTSQALHNTFIQNLASFLAEHTKTLFSPPLFCLLNMNTGILQLINIPLETLTEYSGKESSLDYSVVGNSKHVHTLKFSTQHSVEGKQQNK